MLFVVHRKCVCVRAWGGRAIFKRGDYEICESCLVTNTTILCDNQSI